MISKWIWRGLPLLGLLIALGLFFYFRLYTYLSFSALQAHQDQLSHWVQQNYILTVLVFMLIYIVAVAVSIPGATLFTIVSGFLFGPIFGTVYVVISATLGACCLFLAVRFAIGDWIAERAEGWVKRMEKGFQANALHYTLFLRLVPLFPFWVVNIVPALLDMRLRTFFIATLFGIIPGSLVYVLVGNGLQTVLAQGRVPDLAIIFRPSILAPLIGLAILSLVPVIYQKLKRKRS